ncbi:MFS transporter [Paenibacillus sp. 481]|uniref:MFS transporter n=1 Tax=Paenibacillus sp. 481 TaxID=2835869 RepID=UPI001E5F5002|nr:MFS transporter [Paenibacillus sp. 481]UHA75093.1 MFS transporter [Paenibacillus sp. 481]
MIFYVISIVFGFEIMLSITRPIISLQAFTLGADMTEIGLLTATYAFFPLIFAIQAGRIADKIGDKLPVIVGIISMTLALSLPFFFPFMWALYVSQAVVGVAHIFINISLQNVLGHMATPEKRDHYFSMFSMSVALGGVIGPIAGGYLAQYYSYGAAFLTACMVGIVPIVLSFCIPQITKSVSNSDLHPSNGVSNKGSKQKHPASFFQSLQLLSSPMLRTALFTSALVLYSRDIFIAYFPLLGQQWGLSLSTIGWIITIQGVTMVAIRLLLSKLTTSLGREQVLFASIIVAGLSFLLVPTTSHVIVLACLSGLMGAGLGCGQPLSMTTTYNASPPSRTGEVLGLRLATNRLSQTIAPLLFGVVGAWAGLVAVFYVSGLFLIGGAWVTRTKTEPKVR